MPFWGFRVVAWWGGYLCVVSLERGDWDGLQALVLTKWIPRLTVWIVPWHHCLWSVRSNIHLLQLLSFIGVSSPILVVVWLFHGIFLFQVLRQVLMGIVMWHSFLHQVATRSTRRPVRICAILLLGRHCWWRLALRLADKWLLIWIAIGRNINSLASLLLGKTRRFHTFTATILVWVFMD